MSQFNLFVPANASSTNKVPVLIYMAGLGCDEDNGCATPSSLDQRIADPLNHQR